MEKVCGMTWIGELFFRFQKEPADELSSQHSPYVNLFRTPPFPKLGENIEILEEFNQISDACQGLSSAKCYQSLTY